MAEKFVTLPLSPTDMVDFFQDKEQLHVVQLAETLESMNERSMLLYLANLGIHCSFTEITPELMSEFIVLKEMVNSPDLMGVHANILGYIKYEEILYPELEPVFTVEQTIDFAQSHVDTLAEQLVFLDSFMLYVLTRSDEMTQEDAGEVDEELHDSISMSLIALLNFEDFMITYSQTVPELSEQTYYTRYFDEYMFRGKNMFDYAHTCPFFGFIAAVRSHEEAAGAQAS